MLSDVVGRNVESNRSAPLLGIQLSHDASHDAHVAAHSSAEDLEEDGRRERSREAISQASDACPMVISMRKTTVQWIDRSYKN